MSSKSSHQETKASGGQTIDEGLYSRQLYVLGHDAMKRMIASNILICGLGGLGVEIAKNVILAGVKSVTLYDTEQVSINDLSSQFFLSSKDIGKNRAEASLKPLAELNSYVPLSILKSPLNAETLSRYRVVIMCGYDLETLHTVNHICRQINSQTPDELNHIKFIAADTRGLVGWIFNDFGNQFTVLDPNGVQPLSAMIADIDEEGVVACLDEVRHGFQDGDFVKFSEVHGIQGLNQSEPLRVKVMGPYTFCIGSLAKFGGKYIRGGVATQVKMPQTHSFLSLEASMKAPEFSTSDFSKLDRPDQYHIAIQALHQFKKTYNRLPRPHHEADASDFLQLAVNINEKSTGHRVESVDEKLLKTFAYGCRGELAPMNSVIGGISAQEVIKACSGKFTPIKQWFYFDSLESLPDSYDLDEQSCAPRKSRYDGQICVFGDQLQQKIQRCNIFLVGAGAIGCEMLKNWAMMGIASEEGGKITVTDMDTIEKSNLNRQFLFRSWDVQKLKSECAAKAAKVMNPSLHIVAHQNRVENTPASEKIYDSEFFDSLDCVTNALDNVQARAYVDSRCVFHLKPLLESGTLGTQGNTQVVIPHLTESYTSSRDPPEKSIPICTLKNFPNAIEHTIQWARDVFEGLFKQQPENVNQYLGNPSFIDMLMKQPVSQGIETLEGIKTCIVSQKPLTFEECIVWARLKFEEFFSNSILQLLYNFPRDQKTTSGVPFWSGPKRCPTPITFSTENSLHLDFIIAAANLHAFNYGLKGEMNPNYFKKVLENVMVPEFQPRAGVRIQVSENESLPVDDDDSKLDALVEELPDPSTLAGYRMIPIEFEKDDDTNFHISFITACSNLRASNYEIAVADFHSTKGIAGKIIPAIATTTSLVTGLVCLELYKVLYGCKNIERYKNGFVNLALNFVGFSEPIAAPVLQYGDDKKFTLWDRFTISGDMTLQEFLDYFKKNHDLDITMVSSGVSILYSFFLPPQKAKERKALKLVKLVETISKAPLDSWRKSFVLEICANDANGDAEVPFVQCVL